MSSRIVARLLLDDFCAERLHALDADGILHGDRGQRRQRVAAEAGKGQEIGLDASTGRRIAGGKNQNLGRAGGMG